ncbi:MAG: hypothetical protein R3Y44_05840 [Rikenellaceae bacterium]
MNTFARFSGIAMLAIGMLIAYFTADIDPSRYYGWFHGWWHGMHFTSNWILSLFIEGRLLKAVDYTSWYNIWWWICAVGSVLTTANSIWRVFFPPKM